MVACAVIFCLGIAVSGKGAYAAEYEYGNADKDGFLIQDGILEKYLGTDTEIVVPNGVTAIGAHAFDECQSHVAVRISASVTDIDENAFSDWTVWLITVDDDNTNFSSYDGILYNRDRSKLLRCPEGKLGTVIIPNGVGTIGDYAFSHCEDLLDIYIPESVANIGDNAFINCSMMNVTISKGVESIGRCAFMGCGNLANIAIPNSVIHIGESAFSMCSSLSEVYIPGNLTGIEDRMFQDCNSLTSIIIPEGVTTIGDFAFGGCSRLETITLPESVLGIGTSAFQDCGSLANITIPGSVTEIGFGAFQDCSTLTGIEIPAAVTRIGARVFSGCCRLADVSLPESVESICDFAFYKCGSLKSITLPNKLTDIARFAFSDCASLTNVSIPDGVTKIGDSAFKNCNLTDVAVPNSVTEIGCRALGYKSGKNEDGGRWEKKIPGFAIYGESGSAAETYAKENGFALNLDDNNPGDTTNNNPNPGDNNPGNTTINKPNPGDTEPKNPESQNPEPQNPSTVKVKEIKLSGLSHKIAVGKKITLQATVTPSNAANKSVIWKSSNTKYAAVNSKGVVTIKKAGAGKTVTITAIAIDGNGEKASYKIKCMKGVVKKVAISGQKRRSMKPGKSTKLKAKVTASSGANKTLRWTSSNSKYASVTSKGKVTVKKAGKGRTVRITAIATDGSGKKASVKIKIK